MVRGCLCASSTKGRWYLGSSGSRSIRSSGLWRHRFRKTSLRRVTVLEMPSTISHVPHMYWTYSASESKGT